MNGTLYVVATPLGNLGDLAPRAAEALRQASVVAAEDTRRTRGLLSHLGASPTLLSFHAHSGERRLDTLLEILGDGRDVALVTDAGTPGVSDPGADLVAAAREAGFTVVPIPGPSAVATALSAAGMPADRYLFLGFLPRKGAERTRLIARAAAEEWSVVLFEAPSRLAALLRDLAAAAGPARRAMVARELTKLHEELRAGTLAELADYYSETPPRGELTIVMEGTGAPAPVPDRTTDATEEATALLAEGLSRREVARRLTETLGMPRNDAYRLVMGLP
jgi:16S rRNA (cytidine1402-2'-O)-methyltransferase